MPFWRLYYHLVWGTGRRNRKCRMAEIGFHASRITHHTPSLAQRLVHHSEHLSEHIRVRPGLGR